jgi:hypothetical protein
LTLVLTRSLRGDGRGEELAFEFSERYLDREFALMFTIPLVGFRFLINNTLLLVTLAVLVESEGYFVIYCTRHQVTSLSLVSFSTSVV